MKSNLLKSVTGLAECIKNPVLLINVKVLQPSKVLEIFRNFLFF